MAKIAVLRMPANISKIVRTSPGSHIENYSATFKKINIISMGRPTSSKMSKSLRYLKSFNILGIVYELL